LGSKYKTLETIEEIDGVSFYNGRDEHGHEKPLAEVFGHDRYKDLMTNLANGAVKANKEIEAKTGEKAKDWANLNWQHPLAKARAFAWRNYFAFKENVFCFDFKHAMTIHKSQGSTYENVYLDMDDLAKCSTRDLNMYLRLLYVGISRASNCVYTN